MENIELVSDIELLSAPIGFFDEVIKNPVLGRICHFVKSILIKIKNIVHNILSTIWKLIKSAVIKIVHYIKSGIGIFPKNLKSQFKLYANKFYMYIKKIFAWCKNILYSRIYNVIVHLFFIMYIIITIFKMKRSKDPDVKYTKCYGQIAPIEIDIKKQLISFYKNNPKKFVSDKKIIWQQIKMYLLDKNPLGAKIQEIITKLCKQQKQYNYFRNIIINNYDKFKQQDKTFKLFLDKLCKLCNDKKNFYKIIKDYENKIDASKEINTMQLYPDLIKDIINTLGSKFLLEKYNSNFKKQIHLETINEFEYYRNSICHPPVEFKIDEKRFNKCINSLKPVMTTS